MPKSANSLIEINLEFEDKKERIEVVPGDSFQDEIFKITNGEVFSVICDNDQWLVAVSTSFIADRSNEDSSISSIFYRKSIISSSNGLLTFKMKRINFDFTVQNIQQFDYSLSSTVAVLVQKETLDNPEFFSFYSKKLNWKNDLRKEIGFGSDLIFVHETSNRSLKVFLSPKELNENEHDLTFEDDKSLSHLLFVSDSNYFEEIKTILVNGEREGESYRAVPISSISKFIIKRPTTTETPEETYNINPHPVRESFKANFVPLKLNSVDCIRAYATVFSYLYKGKGQFYAPIASICQCSGAGKSKSATTLLKETPGFYVCIRDAGSSSLVVPQANNVTEALLEIFEKDKYIADSIANQSDLPCNRSTVGKCLMFIANSIKSYINEIGRTLASNLDGNDKDEELLKAKLLSAIKVFSSNNFETSGSFELFPVDSLQNDFLKAAGKISENVNAGNISMDMNVEMTSEEVNVGKASMKANVKVSDVVEYIRKILDDPVEYLEDDLKMDWKEKVVKDKNGKNNNLLEIVRKTFTSVINKDRPFLFFIDEAGLLSKKNNCNVKSDGKNIGGDYSKLQIFRRALSYLNVNTNIFFFTLGTKSTIEDLYPPIIDNSIRGTNRKDCFPPIIMTQNFDIWREKYPLNDLTPCYKTLLNCCMYKFLATLGHPLFSSLNFDDIVKSVTQKLYNGSKNTDMTYLLAVWMIRGGLSCDPKSVFAESLVENHMATLFNIKPTENSSMQKLVSKGPTFGSSSGLASYDITYQSTPCLALAARQASLSLPVENKVEFFRKLEMRIESMVVDRGKLGEATGGLITALLIDSLPQCSSQKLTTELIDEMKTLTPEKFHSLWDSKGSLLCPDAGPLIENFGDYKVYKVEDFLKGLLGMNDADFNRIRELLPSTTLSGLINVSHFVSLSRIDDSLDDSVQSFPTANDFVPDKYRNVITRDRLRLALARQCGIIMPANYYGIDAVIPVCLAVEEVFDPEGNVTIEDVSRPGKENDIPYDLYNPNSEEDKKKNRYRPIYSFIAIQYKSGQYNLDAVPKMQARLHVAPCHKSTEKNHGKCHNCVSELALKEIFDNQISLLYSFLSQDDTSASISIRNQFTMNYGEETKFHPKEPSPAKPIKTQDDFLKALYANINNNTLNELKRPNVKLVEPNSARTFEDFFLRHRIRVNENVELINIYSDEKQGYTYRASDLKKWEIEQFHLKKRKPDAGVNSEASPPNKNKKAKTTEAEEIDPKQPEIVVSEIERMNITDEKDFCLEYVPAKTVDVNLKASSSYQATKPSSPAVTEDFIPEPVIPPYPYDKSRMSTIVLNGWAPWENVIGVEGVKMAHKMLSEYVQDPLRNVTKNDLKLLLPSLKIIMSSKLLGLDRYMESHDDQDDLSYEEWLYCLFEKYRTIHLPEFSDIYHEAKKNFDKI